MKVIDLGVMPYRDAWARQEQAHQEVVSGGGETLFIVEHPPVVTLGRRNESIQNLISSGAELAGHGIELVHSDRGGDITYHAPGQIVAYPIIRIADHALTVSGYVHRLEASVIAALAEMGIAARADPAAVGVWTGASPEKICAIGVRIRRGVTLHGLALNVATDLSGFRHIIPCGLPGRGVTSINTLLAGQAPPLDAVKTILVRHLIENLTR